MPHHLSLKNQSLMPLRVLGDGLTVSLAGTLLVQYLSQHQLRPLVVHRDPQELHLLGLKDLQGSLCLVEAVVTEQDQQQQPRYVGTTIFSYVFLFEVIILTHLEETVSARFVVGLSFVAVVARAVEFVTCH